MAFSEVPTSPGSNLNRLKSVLRLRNLSAGLRVSGVSDGASMPPCGQARGEERGAGELGGGKPCMGPGCEGVGVVGWKTRPPTSQVRNRVPEFRAIFWGLGGLLWPQSDRIPNTRRPGTLR